MDNAKQFVIDNEDTAWEVLRRVLNHEVEFDETSSIEFKNWPVIEFKVNGRRWQSSIPTRIMPAILEVQKDLHRAYARVNYGDNNVKRLSSDERDALEIVVKVSQGSSEFMALIEGAMNTFVDKAVAKMTAEQIVVTVIGVSLVIAGRLSWKDWLNARQEQKESDERVALSQEETRRLEVLGNAMKQQPIIAAVKKEADLTRDDLVKSMDDPDMLHVGDMELPGHEAKQLIKKERERSVPVRIDGLFRITEVRPLIASFRLGLKRIKDDFELNAEVKDAVLNHDMREALKQGEWGRMPIQLSINAHELRGNIVSAEVSSVSMPDEEAGQ